jgi:serine/threonine protein kinase/Tfp pilus assembly protein PilF
MWEQGQRVDTRTFLARNPDIQPTRSIVKDLAYEELCLRQEAHEVLDVDAFCAQLPGYRASVRRMISALHFAQEQAHALPSGGSRPWPEKGTRFLGFELQRELGRGAFARVFLATEPALGHRLVVVKVSFRGASEAETLGRLNHPNIVPVHSVQKEEPTGLSVVCMPYLGCATLEDVLDWMASPGVELSSARAILDAVQDPLLPAAGAELSSDFVLRAGSFIDGVVHLGKHLAEALAWIHARGICHLDLKPSNVLMTPAGRPMLLDFNLATDEQLAGPRDTGGTLPYMSPEQLLATGPTRSAAPSLIDARSDLYSFGIILYELLTGIHPFGPIPLKLSQDDLCKFLLERQRQPLLPVRKANPRVPSSLARLIGRCLAYNPNDRPQSAGEIALVFQQYLSAWRRRLSRWIAGRKRLVLASAVPVLVLLAGAGVLAVREHESRHPFAQGIQAYQEGHWETALDRFNVAIEADPNNAQRYLARARVHQQLGKIVLACTDYDVASRLTPADGRYQAGVGYCFNQLQGHAEANECYAKALEKGFQPAEVFNNMAYGRMVTTKWAKPGRGREVYRNLKEIYGNLNEAIRRNEKLQAAYYNRALFLLMLTDQPPDWFGCLDLPDLATVIAQGNADIQKAIDLGPKTADLYANAFLLAEKAAQQGRFVQVALLVPPLTSNLYGNVPPLAIACQLDGTGMDKTLTFQALSAGIGRNHPPVMAPRFVDPIAELFP